jgi:hypothetical protein
MTTTTEDGLREFIVTETVEFTIRGRDEEDALDRFLASDDPNFVRIRAREIEPTRPHDARP